MKNPALKRDYVYEKLVDDPEDPLFNEEWKGTGVPWHVIRIPFKHFIKVIILLPLGAFMFCVYWAMNTNYERATTVVCVSQDNRRVVNYLPSLSAAIGDFELSQSVWRICILCHAPGRLLFASMYLKYLRKVIAPKYVNWAMLAVLCHVLEILGLVGLTVVSSKRNLFVHAVNFGIFIVCSVLYMNALCLLMSRCRQVEMNKLEQRGLVVKRWLCRVVLICSILLVVTYFRHESYCEQGVYTIFALLEYIVVLSNIGFNGSAYWDFYDRTIFVDVFSPCMVSARRYSWDY